MPTQPYEENALGTKKGSLELTLLSITEEPATRVLHSNDNQLLSQQRAKTLDIPGRHCGSSDK